MTRNYFNRLALAAAISYGVCARRECLANAQNRKPRGPSATESKNKKQKGRRGMPQPASACPASNESRRVRRR